MSEMTKSALSHSSSAMAVLITRPEGEGEELCRLVQAQGITAHHYPLIRFLPGKDNEGLLPLLSGADIIIAVSKQAVLWADKILQSQQENWPSTALYFAIGQKTAEKLGSVSHQQVCYPEVSDSEHFLQLSALQNIEHKRVVILRGNGGRELIYSTLTTRLATVDYCEVYQRHKQTFDGQSILNDWQEKNITHVITTSGEQLEHLFQQVPDKQWLCNRWVIVPSKRIAYLANELGFNNVLVSGSASNPDLLAAILPQCTTGQAHDK